VETFPRHGSLRRASAYGIRWLKVTRPFASLPARAKQQGIYVRRADSGCGRLAELKAPAGVFRAPRGEVVTGVESVPADWALAAAC